MADLKFDEVVQQGYSTYIDKERGYKALCSTCGTYRQVSVEEFEFPFTVKEEELEYAAKMRAWNCCHEGEEPEDGLPEGPESFK